MKTLDVYVRGFYEARIGRRRTLVRIDAVAPDGGWYATNTSTVRPVRVVAAQLSPPDLPAIGPVDPERVDMAVADIVQYTPENVLDTHGSFRLAILGPDERDAVEHAIYFAQVSDLARAVAEREPVRQWVSKLLDERDRRRARLVFVE
jgi:hypothetical protein